MISHEQHLQPDDYPALVKALSAVDYRLDLLPTPIRAYWDPRTCPLDALKHLAHAFSVDLWYDDWPEDRKRSVVARSIELHRLKGTRTSPDEFALLVDAQVVRKILPSDHCWASAPISKAQRDAWLARMPEIRVYYMNEVGDPGAAAFADVSFVGRAFATFDTAEAIYGRRAMLRQNGIETRLKRATVETVTTQRAVKVTERAFIPGLAGSALFEGGYARLGYITKLYKQPQVVTYSLDRSYADEFSVLHLNTLEPGLVPIDMLYRRRSTIGRKGPSMFAKDFTRLSYVTPDVSGQMLYDGVYLNDPDLDAPWVRAHSFTDISRIGVRHHTAEIQISATSKAKIRAAFAGSGFVGLHAARETDMTKTKRVYEAMRASKSARDKIIVTTQTHRPMEFRDRIPLDGSRKFGDQVKYRI